MDDVQATTAFMALGNEVRFEVFRLLAPYGSEGLPAGVIADRVGLKPTAISFHLAGMTAAGVLIQRRIRRNLFYSVNDRVVTDLASFLLRAVSPGASSSEGASSNAAPSGGTIQSLAAVAASALIVPALVAPELLNPERPNPELLMQGRPFVAGDLVPETGLVSGDFPVARSAAGSSEQALDVANNRARQILS